MLKNLDFSTVLSIGRQVAALLTLVQKSGSDKEIDTSELALIFNNVMSILSAFGIKIGGLKFVQPDHQEDDLLSNLDVIIGLASAGASKIRK